MKNTIKFMIGLLAIGLVSCEPEFENAVTLEILNVTATFDNAKVRLSHIQRDA